jgi:CheY-like chemotaxis protein
VGVRPQSLSKVQLGTRLAITECAFYHAVYVHWAAGWLAVCPLVGLNRESKMSKVLVVDDAQDGADSLALLFQALGHQTATAYDGAQAVEASHGFLPDFIILDIAMPLMNGLEAARALRIERPVTPPVLIALTALTGSNVEQQTLDSGFDFYMSKPAGLEKLVAIVDLTKKSRDVQSSL